MQRDVESAEAYRALLEGGQRALVERIHAVLREVAPEIEVGIAHGMLDYPGLASLAAQKRYVALYVAPPVLAQHKRRFPGVDAGKSCLRFTKLDQADPVALRTLLSDVRAYRVAKLGA